MNAKRQVVALSIAGLLLGSSGLAQAMSVNVTVPGTSDPWLAGMPVLSNASTTDYAPWQSPAQVLGFNIGLGGYLTFTGATGGVINYGGCPGACMPIDGGSFYSHDAGAENGISDVRAPINALLGVFLDAGRPNSSAAPSALNFSTIGLDFTMLSPVLKQVFFIGDGRTSGNVTQTFVIPTGATRLFLGTMDGYEWSNNSGAIRVNVNSVPLPAAAWAFGSGLLLLIRQGSRRRA